MEKNIKNKEKNNNPAFAFLPDMVLEHLNYATLAEIHEISNKPKEKKIIVPIEFQASFVERVIEIVEEIKTIEPAEESILETQNSQKKENIIIQFLKKIKINLYQF